MKKQKIRILYDYQILTFQKRGGISRYFYELYSNLKKKDITDISVNISAVFSCNYYFTQYLKRVNNYPKYIGNLCNRMVIIFKIWKGFLLGKEIDIIHPTFYYPDYLKYIPRFIRKKSKIVITVYDLIYELFYPADENKKKREQIMNEADGIIAISEHTKQDILRIYPSIPQEKIKVIYLGNSMQSPNEKNKVSLPEHYILMVGNRNEYKNGQVLFEAFKLIKQKNKELKLLCIGGGEFEDAEWKLFEKLGIQKDVVQMSVDDDGLYYAYTNARCFVFPSLYEGFGLPILEAFYCKCPVILSNASCFPEIAQKGALYFNPNDSKELAEKIEYLINNPTASSELVERGNKQLEKFSWSRTVEETYKFYHEIID